MATNRKITFVNNYVYHVYNRSIEGRPIFKETREYGRFILTLDYYRYQTIPIRYSHFNILSNVEQQKITSSSKNSAQIVEILAYCIMPNHFHLMLLQKEDGGISKYLSQISNSYAKYFNTKYKRVGPLFQSAFKAEFVETNEQLLHLSRYIHLNPVVSALIKTEELSSYQWSSYPTYLGKKEEEVVNKEYVFSQFTSPSSYERFVIDQIDYAKNLEKIKHLLLED